jgi:isoleucyl-tRNA synthetase
VLVLAAPVVPFAADWLHRALRDGASVHLERFSDLASADWAAVVGTPDRALEADMDAARTLVSLGRAAREDVQIRVRQPLRGIRAVVPGGRALSEEVLDLVRDELNVKSVGFLSSAEGLVTLLPRPNFRALGSRFGKRTNDVANAIRALPQDVLMRWQAGEPVSVVLAGESLALEAGDLDVAQEAAAGLVVKGEGAFTVALDPELDDALRAEGVARELVNRIQRLRKDAGLDITDRIELVVAGPDPVRAAAGTHGDFITRETLAVSLRVEAELGDDGMTHVRDVDLDGTPARLGLGLPA